MDIIRNWNKTDATNNKDERLCEHCFLAKCPLKVSEFFTNSKASKTALNQRKVQEAIFVVEGEVNVVEVEKGRKREEVLKEGDFVIFAQSGFNLLKNKSGKRTKILSFTFLGDKKGKENIYFIWWDNINNS